MLRGLIAGMFSGAALAGGALVVLAVLLPPPTPTEAPAPEASTAPDLGVEQSADQSAVPEAATAPDGPAAAVSPTTSPAVVAPEQPPTVAEPDAAASDADAALHVSPPDVALVPAAPDAITTPDTVAAPDAPEVSTTIASLTTRSDAEAAKEADTVARGADIVSQPDLAVVPLASDDPALTPTAALSQLSGEEALADVTPLGTIAPVADVEIPAMLVTPLAPDAPPASAAVESAPAVVAADPDALASRPADMIAVAGDDAMMPAPAALMPAPAAVADETEADSPAQPTPGLARLAPEVRTGRLPTITTMAAPVEPPAPATASEPVATPELAADAPALLRNAHGFVDPEGRPPFVILLHDDGQIPLDPAVLPAGLPLTLVIDPDVPDAAARAAAWHEAGHEVAIAAGAVPQSTAASDMEVALEALGATLPSALAIVDAGGRIGDRRRLAVLLPALAARGFGLVTPGRGLNTVGAAAAAAGVPSSEIYRMLDAEDEAAPVIQRYLGRAAFKAQQDGQVVVMGRLRPETLTGIADWASDPRAVANVAPAPLSSVLPLPAP